MGLPMMITPLNSESSIVCSLCGCNGYKPTLSDGCVSPILFFKRGEKFPTGNWG